MERSIGWVCVLAVVAGCGGKTSGTADSGGALDTGVPPTDTGAPPIDTGVPPTDTGAPPVDTGAPPTDTGVPADAAAACSFIDSVDRSCTSDTDCVVRLHQTDCCGNAVMVGVNQSVAAQFAVDESACMASYPGCGCPARRRRSPRTTWRCLRARWTSWRCAPARGVRMPGPVTPESSPSSAKSSSNRRSSPPRM